MTDEDDPSEVVIYDACVLYPYTLRDTLISLTKTRKFRARWTAAITDEWTRSLREKEPGINAERLKRTGELMLQAVPDAVIEGYEHIICELYLPDPDDRHVLAAAIHAQASKIITANTKHFPQGVLSPLEIEVCRPDAFVAGLLKDHPVEVLKEFRKQRLRLKNPHHTADEFLGSLSKAGLVVTVSMLRENVELL